jgi:hypothetical protein
MQVIEMISIVRGTNRARPAVNNSQGSGAKRESHGPGQLSAAYETRAFMALIFRNGAS